MSADEAESNHLTDEQLQELRNRLLAMRRELLSDTALNGSRRVAGDEQNVGDESDRAMRDRQRELQLQLGQHEREQLREIDAALERMDEGTYGICEETDEPIPFKRLQAIPTARYTVETQQQLEEERALGRQIQRDMENERYSNYESVAEEEQEILEEYEE